MPHTDPDCLALIALGDGDAYEAASDHLRGCTTCAQELDALREVAALGAESRLESDLPMPSSEVWERIAAETGQGAETVPAISSAATRKRFPAVLRMVAVTVAAAVFGGAVVFAADLLNRPAVVVEQVVANADLVALPSAPGGASGSVQVVRRSGEVVLRLRMSGMPPPEGLYQVWLFDGGTTMIPLGVLTDGRVDFSVPSSVDVASFPIVDVSAQRLGQQEHGVSVLQGKLR